MLKIEALTPDLILKSTQDQVVLSRETQSEVDAIWAAEQVRRSQPMHDGELFSLAERTEAQWTGAFVPYSRFVAQLVAPDLFEDLQVRPVAVSGVLTGPDGVVFGRRARTSTQFAGWWELAPSGGLDRACLRPDGTIDYVAKVLEELVEETGCPPRSLNRVNPFAVVEDTAIRSIDIGIELSTTLNRSELWRHAREDADGEYETIEVVRRDEVTDFIRRHGGEIVDVSLALLEQLGCLAKRA